MTLALVASPDGRWVVARRDRTLAAYANAELPAKGTAELPGDDFELAILGTPPVVVVVTGGRGTTPPGVQIHRLPELDQVARVELPGPMSIATSTGARLALLSTAGKLLFVRITPRALALQPTDPGGAVDLAVGLERDQALLGMARRLEVWDASLNRPALRLQLQLPSPPRVGGAAKGHLWSYRVGDEDLYVYRLSDGRPFRHHAGAVIHAVVSTLSSPYAVIVTSRGLIRLNCFAHSLHVLDSPWTPGSAIALLGADEDVALAGIPPESITPWRAHLVRPAAPTTPPEPPAPPSVSSSISDAPVPTSAGTNPFSTSASAANPFSTGVAAPFGASEGANPFASPNPFATSNPFITASGQPGFGVPAGSPLAALHPEAAGRAPFVLPEEAAGPAPPPRPPYRPLPPAPEAYLHGWRAPFAERGAELASGASGLELPAPDPGCELDQLVKRFDLQPSARRTLGILYALYLVGEGAPSIARLAHAAGEWVEALGRGELGALGLLRHTDGHVALREAVTDFLDGRPPRACTLVGTAPLAPTLEPGSYRVARDSKPDAELVTDLAHRLGAIGVCTGDVASAALEAMLRGAAAVAFTPPTMRPPLPSEARLVLVLPSGPTAWLADLPALP